ncbi:MAG: hypothetical protein M1818_003079 [Claussenomyces sp. TS43310]|nr:MAG: hypothetical protein M1818_003079 [Claussenomyces sp. TS43310]
MRASASITTACERSLALYLPARIPGESLLEESKTIGIPADEHAGRQIASARKEMLRYYIQTFSILLTTNLENNCFLSVFLPMAMDSPTLLNAIIAWSASHLSLRDANYKEVALHLRGLSLSSLSSIISPSQGKPELEVALSSCLVLCGMESILGDNERWYQHLSGAFEVIRSSTTMDVGKDSALVPTGFLATTDGRWLLRNFAYHDVFMSVTCQRRPLLTGNYWANADEPTADSYFGLASRLIYLISEISVLNADMSEMADFIHVSEVTSPLAIDHDLIEPFFDDSHLPDSSPDSTATFSTRAHILELRLLQWQCAPSKSLSLVSLAEAYRLAALIHLYRTLRAHLTDLRSTLDFKISQVVENMVECLETMPAGCLPESGLLFPLFLAGGEAHKAEHIEVIRQRMLDIVEARHFANVRAALDVLDELWRSRARCRGQTGLSEDLDWTKILEKRNWKLPLT